MHHPVLVGVAERLGCFPRDPERVVERKLRLALEPVPERLALDVGHGEPQLPRGFAGVVDR